MQSFSQTAGYETRGCEATPWDSLLRVARLL
jgi:hypothetical protein